MNAAEARVISRISSGLDDKLNRVLAEIKIAAQNGKFELFYTEHICQRTFDDLYEHGFHADSKLRKISW